jgi:LuxR family maltose regulon positive regulatory protein
LARLIVLYFSDFAPEVRPVDAVRARVWLSEGRVPEAQRWVREHRLSTADDLTYVREFEYATLARVLLAQGIADGAEDPMRAAIELTERLLTAAEAGGRNGSALDILIVQALARHAADDPGGATAALARAIEIAEPEGYVRLFIDEGPSMVPCSSSQPKIGTRRDTCGSCSLLRRWQGRGKASPHSP